MAQGNYITPDNKSAYSYDTQILATLDDGTELWNVTDYSRSTSNLQIELFAHTAGGITGIPKSVRPVDVLSVLRGETDKIKTNRVRDLAIASTYTPKRAIILRRVPKNTRNLIEWYMQRPIINAFPELCKHVGEDKCVGCGGRCAHTLNELQERVSATI